MGIKLGPPLLPPARKADQMQHRGRIGEDAGLLVGRLVEPPDAHGGREPLQGAGESAASVVALDRRLPRVRRAEHVCHEPLGQLHRLARVDRIGDVDRTVGVDGIAQRTEVVVARVGRIGVVAPAHDVAGKRIVLGELEPVEQPFAGRGAALIHALELQRIEPPLGIEQCGAVLLGPQGGTRRTRVDLGGRRSLERFEIEVQPAVAAEFVQLAPRAQSDEPLAAHERADQILVVPAREDDQLARSVVHAGSDHRRVPLPAVLAHERRVGLQSVLVEVVEYETVYAIARERTLAAHGENAAAPAHDLGLVGRADAAGRLGTPLEGRFGKERGIFGRVDNALHAAVEPGGQCSGIGGDSHPQIGVEPQQIGRQEGRGADALAVLRGHRDDQTADAPRSEGFEHAVVGAVERLQFEKRIDAERKIGESGYGKRHKAVLNNGTRCERDCPTSSGQPFCTCAVRELSRTGKSQGGGRKTRRTASRRLPRYAAPRQEGPAETGSPTGSAVPRSGRERRAAPHRRNKCTGALAGFGPPKDVRSADDVRQRCAAAGKSAGSRSRQTAPHDPIRTGTHGAGDECGGGLNRTAAPGIGGGPHAPTALRTTTVGITDRRGDT